MIPINQTQVLSNFTPRLRGICVCLCSSQFQFHGLEIVISCDGYPIFHLYVSSLCLVLLLLTRYIDVKWLYYVMHKTPVIQYNKLIVIV